jgi:hypothetical protein
MMFISIIWLTACSSGGTGEVRASPGKEFTLPAGQTAVISGEDLSIKFEQVTADSRCAKGVVCVWAGEAKCQMQITYQGSIYPVIFTASGGTDGYSHEVFNQYKVSFRLDPYPEAGKSITPGDYRLIMTVS